MPFDAASAEHHPAAHAPSSDRSVRVFPCIDACSGAVLLVVEGRQENYRCSDPQRLTRALSRVVRPVLWLAAERKLLLAVAARGYRAGKELCFTLE